MPSSSAPICRTSKKPSSARPSAWRTDASVGAGRGRSDGYVLTNNHVISIAANGGSVEVLFSDGQTGAATITGRDPQTDLAVLKVQTSHELKVISLGSSSSVKVGEPVVAIGAPLGRRVTHAFFGLQTVPIPPAAAAQAGVPEGLYVRAVTAGGPAVQAGLRPDDVKSSRHQGNPVGQ